MLYNITVIDLRVLSKAVQSSGSRSLCPYSHRKFSQKRLRAKFVPSNNIGTYKLLNRRRMATGGTREDCQESKRVYFRAGSQHSLVKADIQDFHTYELRWQTLFEYRQDPQK